MHGSAVCARACIVALCSAGAAGARAESCPARGAEPVVLAAVAQRLELRLVDGRVLRLAGLEAAERTPTTPDRDAKGPVALAALLRDRPLTVTILSPQPDRWGRLVAFASTPDEPAGGLAAAALAAGLARYRPEPAAASCRATWLAAEDEARRARRGLWADPFYGILAADDRAAVTTHAGMDVIVEARLRAVEPGRYRTRLRFDGGTRGGGGLIEATIVPRAMKAFAARGMDVHALIGRILRVRGLLDHRFGPRVELGGPDDLELVSDIASPARAN